MLIGEYTHALDDKNRVSLPAKFRKILGKKVVITPGLDNCLFLFTKAEWQKLAEKLSALPFSQAHSRAFARLMLAGAMDVEFDKQGRALIPEYLRQFAGLKKSVIIAGLYSRLEIWDEHKWHVYKKQTEAESGNIAEKMGELGV